MISSSVTEGVQRHLWQSALAIIDGSHVFERYCMGDGEMNRNLSSGILTLKILLIP
jgi:hypothetical protein